MIEIQVTLGLRLILSGTKPLGKIHWEDLKVNGKIQTES
jgi:hypothetical protein